MFGSSQKYPLQKTVKMLMTKHVTMTNYYDNTKPCTSEKFDMIRMSCLKRPLNAITVFIITKNLSYHKLYLNKNELYLLSMRVK